MNTKDIFSFSSFDPSKMQESFRDFAEKGAVQSKEAYAKMKSATEEATKTVEATVQTAQAGTVELGLKAIDAMRTTLSSSEKPSQTPPGSASSQASFSPTSASARWWTPSKWAKAR
jgi:hypothetical protein